jgi:hypothetical protein
VLNAHQSGFMPNKSHEHCVFTLIETVRARWREGKDTWVMFLDFFKAYDRVSPALMWEVLARMGVPHLIINYLKYTYKTRTTHFSFNGRVVDCWTQQLGLPQGGVLSCLLFNLFIESLSRFLENHEKINGVQVTTPGGIAHILHMLFADDMAVLAETRSDLVIIAEAIDKWCIAHGLTVAVSGTDKSAFMHMALKPRRPEEPLPPPLTIRRGHDRSNDLVIPATSSYVYIGQAVTSDLDPRTMQQTILKKLRAGIATFKNGGILKRLGFQLQRSYMISVVFGAASHLMAMAPTGQQFETEMNNILLDAIAHVLQTTTKYLTQTGPADMRVLDARSLLLKAKERFRLSATANDVPAAHLLRVIHADKFSSDAQLKLNPRLRSWCASYYDLTSRIGSDPTWTMNLSKETSKPWEVHARADIAARKAAQLIWTTEAQLTLKKQKADVIRDPQLNQKSPGPTLFALQLAGVAERDANAPTITKGMFRPSDYGAGIGSSVLGYQSLNPDTFIWLHRARLGILALFTSPFWFERQPQQKKLGKKASDEMIAAHAAEEARTSTVLSNIFSTTCCYLCKQPGGDLTHFCTTCTNPAMTVRRTNCLGNGKLAMVVRAITEATYYAHRTEAPAYLNNAINNLTIGTPEANFITERIITSSPWKQADVNPTWTVSVTLGRMFEKPLATGRAREWADDWANPARNILVSIGAKWWQLLPTAEKARLIAVGYRLPQTKPADTGT